MRGVGAGWGIDRVTRILEEVVYNPGMTFATQMLGGPMTFVLSNAGHVASLVNPPGNPKATYWLGPKPGPDPEAWLAKATKPREVT